jgi:hypothetical protein
LVTGVLEARERHVPERPRGNGLNQWALVIAPLAIAFEQQQLSYELVGWACRHSSVAVLHAVSVVALLLVFAVGLLSWRTLHRVGWRAPGDERSSDAAERFVAALAMLMAGFAALLVVAQSMPGFFFHPCQR